MNRAVDGDIVAFELLPEAEWFSQDGMPGEPAKEEVSTTKHVVEPCLRYFGLFFATYLDIANAAHETCSGGEPIL